MRKLCLAMLLFIGAQFSVNAAGNMLHTETYAFGSMQVVYHTFKLPESKGDADLKALYKVLYTDINIFHVELDNNTKVATVITRPQITGESIVALLKSNGFRPISLVSEQKSVEAYDIEQKALERNRIAKSQK